MNEPVYRIPPYVIEGEPLLKSDIKDIVDWGLLAQAIPEQWSKTRGNGILIGIIDTGEAIHTDLPKPYFSINFSSSPTVADKQGHATHVAGTIGARANDAGVVGVAPDVALGYCKGLGDDGSGSQNGLANAIKRCHKEGCHIISMSWGGGFSRAIEDALLAVEADGILCVAAAGNDGYNGTNTVNHPASSAASFAIGSYNSKGEISKFSSGGKEVDVAFPGENILSTWLNNRYNRISGTSMATPFASAVAALAMASYRDRTTGWVPKLRISRAKEILKATAQDKGPSGQDDRWGWGIVDVGKVVGWGSTPPITPPPTAPPEIVKIGPYSVTYKNGVLAFTQG